MSPANRQIRVVALCDPGATQQQIVETLKTQEQSTMDIIDDLALQFPTVAIVAILPSNDPLVAQQVMLAGARAFLIVPFSQINLISTLRRVTELEGRRQQSQTYIPSQLPEALRPLRSATFYSPRGGTGVTSLAVNTAIALAEESGKKVLLFEGKVFFGHLEVILDLKVQNALSDLIPHATNLDENLIHDVVCSHPSGIHVLLAPNNVQIAQGIRAEDIYNIFVGVSRHYDYIVVDAGGPLNDISVTLMDAADPTEKILMILNKAGIEGGIKLKDIEAVLHTQIYHQIANDPANVLRSINRGIPFLVYYPRSNTSKSIQQLARNLMAINLREAGHGAEPVAAQKTGSDMLLASSRLG
jgi:pilus assembly protein CpaE